MDRRGMYIGSGVLACWAGVLLFALHRSHPLPVLLLLVPVLTFLHTGLFITAHDAMHGTVAPGQPRINAAFGRVATVLYALFSFAKLRAEHGLHHVGPGTERDPDFHDGARLGFFRWYLRFVRHYVTVWQFVGMAVVFNVFEHLVGVPKWNLLLCWVLPSVLSTLQLFFFGTYLPHREPGGGHRDEHRATSSGFPPWLSFLSCYHFGYHHEHHVAPSIPWWRLPAVRRAG